MIKRFLCGKLIVRSLFCQVIERSQRLTEKDQLPADYSRKQSFYITVNGGRVVCTWTNTSLLFNRARFYFGVDYDQHWINRDDVEIDILIFFMH